MLFWNVRKNISAAGLLYLGENLLQLCFTTMYYLNMQFTLGLLNELKLELIKSLRCILLVVNT